MISVLAPGSGVCPTLAGWTVCECHIDTVGKMVQTFCIFAALGGLVVQFSTTFFINSQESGTKVPSCCPCEMICFSLFFFF